MRRLMSVRRPFFAAFGFAILGSGLTSCAPSPLLRSDDGTFRLASQHFGDVASHLSREPIGKEGKDLAIREDEAVFLQAEAFYHYRFELQAPAARNYAAQAVAAASDFSPLNSLAASGGIGDLRLMAYSGAAQLYERLLARHPMTSLRPLALYRLGWAYRSANVSGFPRSSDAAFDGVVKASPGSPLARLSLEAKQVPYKTQDAAVAWSIIPGAGQMYVGQWRSGAVRLSIAATFAAATIIPIVYMAKNGELDWRGVTISLLGIVGLQVSYTMAYQDAQRAAVLFNERQEAWFGERHPEAP
jgi:hypothetical protein